MTAKALGEIHSESVQSPAVRGHKGQSIEKRMRDTTQSSDLAH